MATHTFQPYLSGKTGIEPILKSGRQVPGSLLGIKSQGHLVQVSISICDMRISMLARANNIIHFLRPLINRIGSIQTELLYPQGVILPKRMIIKIGIVVMNNRVAVKLCRALPLGSHIKTLPHTRPDKSFVNFHVALLAGVYPDIMDSIAMIEILIRTGICAAIGEKKEKGEKNNKSHL